MNGNLVIVERRREGPVYYAKWRLADGTQVKRRLGPAWVSRSPTGTWTRRRGRATAGFLTEKDGIVEMDRLIREHGEDAGRPVTRRAVLPTSQRTGCGTASSSAG